MKKRLLSLFLVLGIIFTLFTPMVMAEDVNLRYVPCPIGPRQCKMNMRGTGFLDVVENGKTTRVINDGFTYQCHQCYNTVICEKNAYSGALGTYYLYNPGEESSPNGSYATTTPDQVDYCSSIKDTYYLKDCIWTPYK